MSVVIGLMFTIAIQMFIAGYRRIRTPGYEAQLEAIIAARQQRPRTRYERLVRPLALRLADSFGALRGLSDPVQLARQLDYANHPAGLTAHELYGVQLYFALVGLLTGGLWFYLGMPFGPIALLSLPIAGFYAPRLWLRGKVRRRQRAITVALPDLLDMLAVCVSAGMGFDIALALLTERGEGPIYEELDRLLRELRIGEPREQAFRHMSERNSSKELRQFIDALLQAEELGAPIATTLERQAEDMRVTRRHRARAQGAKAATKIALVVVMLVMPSVLCIIGGGLILSISRSGGELFSLLP
jgi:tight adherence protein C